MHGLLSVVFNATYKKPGTAKVGAISKAQKAQNFLNCKRGDPLGFLKLQFSAKYEKNGRVTHWSNYKIPEKNKNLKF